jgi:hypothetical protein
VGAPPLHKQESPHRGPDELTRGSKSLRDHETHP